MKVVGDNGSMELAGDFVVISRAIVGPGTSSYLVGRPERAIPVSSITEVRYKPAGLFRGHLRLSVEGRGDERALATDDENAVIFSERSLLEFERFHLALLDRVRTMGGAMGADLVHANAAS